MCRLINNKPIENNDNVPSPNFEFPVYEAKEESGEYDDILEEITWLLEHEEKTIHPYKKLVEPINLGFEENKREVKIGALLGEYVKKRLVELLKEHVDVFVWSYQDIPGLDTNIVEHRLSLRPECPPMKQKLRRAHLDMAIKIRE